MWKPCQPRHPGGYAREAAVVQLTGLCASVSESGPTGSTNPPLTGPLIHGLSTIRYTVGGNEQPLNHGNRSGATVGPVGSWMDERGDMFGRTEFRVQITDRDQRVMRKHQPQLIRNRGFLR